MEIIIEDIGLMDNSMEKGSCSIKTKEVMRVVGKMEKKMAMECIYGVTESNIVVLGSMIKLMEEENLSTNTSKRIV